MFIVLFAFSNQVLDFLRPGDVMLAYSDGIIEAANVEEEMIGQQWLLEALKDLSRPAEDMAQHIIDEVHRFGGQQNFYDDITLVVVKRHRAK